MNRHSSRSCPLDDRAQCHPAITSEHLDHCAAEDLISFMPVLPHIVHFSCLIVHDVLSRVKYFFLAVSVHPLSRCSRPHLGVRLQRTVSTHPRRAEPMVGCPTHQTIHTMNLFHGRVKGSS